MGPTRRQARQGLEPPEAPGWPLPKPAAEVAAMGPSMHRWRPRLDDLLDIGTGDAATEAGAGNVGDIESLSA